MRQDIDRLMEERNLDAAVVMGSTVESPTVYYLTGGVKLEGVMLIFQKDAPSLLIHHPIERDNAAETGYDCLPYTHWDIGKIFQAVEGNALMARAELIRQILAESGVRGQVGFYGHGEIGSAHTLLSALQTRLHASEIVTEYDRDLFSRARETKDQAEIDVMKDLGRRTCQVVGAVADLLTSRPVSNNHLVASDGEPMTIGHVKDFIRGQLANLGLEEPAENIFATGADAGVPHNHGDPNDVLELGKSIIFDIFPRPQGGGYYHDMTRTWCLGYAPPEVEQAYEDVMTSFDLAVAALKVGRLTAEYQVLTCEYFESQGHPTSMTDFASQSGYVHSLGHGLGLQVHEAPGFSHLPGNTATLEPGTVFTIEPGLYYPELGYGVRVEDTYICDHDGVFHSITPFAKDLVLPVGR